MKYDKEFLAGMYPAYYGCQLYSKRLPEEYQGMHSVDGSILEDMDHTIEEMELKLALKPLSKISNEDAIAIIKMDFHPTVLMHKTESELAAWGRSFLDGVTVPALTAEMTDYLRQKGYDCGYSGFNKGEFITIPSLIKEGLAEEIS